MRRNLYYLEDLAHGNVPAVLHEYDVLEQPVLLVHPFHLLLDTHTSIVEVPNRVADTQSFHPDPDPAF
jgi:hypothetical protein